MATTSTTAIQQNENQKTADNNIDFGGLMSLEDVYSLTREFVKTKEGTKAVQLSYHDRNMLNVLTKQVRYSKFSDEKNKVGFLDLVGQDRM